MQIWPLPEQGHALKEVHSLEKSIAALNQGPPSPVFEIIVRVTAIGDAGWHQLNHAPGIH